MTENTPLDTGRLMCLLGTHRRRALLRYLRSHRDSAVDLADLTDGVRQRCRDDRVPETRMETRIQLHHIDLPKLEDANVLTYDETEGSVVYEGHERVESALETIAAQVD